MSRIAVLIALGCLGCTKAQLVDFTMASAPHHVHSPATVGPYRLLAGDMHCHLQPPDAPYHVSRQFPATVKLAVDEGLDFVVLTPHVPRRFFLDASMRDWVQRTQREIRAQIAADTSGVVWIPGMEYTDHEFGHLGMSFGDLDATLEAVPADAKPERFFEVWESLGGLTTINHPFLYGTPKVPIAELHYDLSWRGYAEPGTTPEPFPEIRWLTNHADAVETWNESVGHVRDRYIFDDATWTMRQSTHLVDRLARAQERRIAPVGGTDSHGDWLRPTMWLLAKDKSPAAIREAIVRGRTCVRGPEACTVQVNGAYVGDAVESANHVVEARAEGDATYFVNGELVAHGPEAKLAVPGTCSVVRAQIGDSMSAPIYVDCAWAEAGTPR